MRLEPLRKDQLTDEQAELFAALVGRSLVGDERGRSEARLTDADGTVRGPFAVMLHHPATGHPLQRLGGVLRFRGMLPDTARELVILAVAAHCGSEFEWQAHEPIARDAGVDAAAIAALRAGTALTLPDPIDDAAVATARGILVDGDLADDDYARVQGVLGDQQLIEVTLLVGYYSLLAMQMRLFRIRGNEPST